MPTTSRFALPYPNNTDPVSAYPAQAQTLAKTVDTYLKRVASGTVTITPTAANEVTSAVVTFPVGRFTETPIVVVSGRSTNPAAATVSFSGEDSSSVTIYVLRANTNPTPVRWIAIQE